MDKEKQHFDSEKKRDAEKSGPRYPEDAGNRNTDEQAAEQRATSKSSEQFVHQQVDEKGKKRQ